MTHYGPYDRGEPWHCEHCDAQFPNPMARDEHQDECAERE